MSKFPIKSVFEQISSHIFTSTDTLDADKKYIIEFIASKHINDNDKKTILRTVNEVKSKIKLQTYIANSLLKYEGLSVNNRAQEGFLSNEETF
jgi:hypothetical protein